MSQQTVELVRRLQPGPDIDLVQGFRDDALARDFGRRKGSDAEVSLTAAGVWTVRDGRIARAEFYAERAEALQRRGYRRSQGFGCS